MRLGAPSPESRDALRAAIEGDTTRTILLAGAVPIHLLYETGWVDLSGAVSFRRDLYGRDATRLDALAEPMPERTR